MQPTFEFSLFSMAFKAGGMRAENCDFHAGGMGACSRWSSEAWRAIPPVYDCFKTAPRRGASQGKCMGLASLRDAFSLMYWFRWYRSPSLARPPATSCKASGFKSRRKQRKVQGQLHSLFFDAALLSRKVRQSFWEGVLEQEHAREMAGAGVVLHGFASQ